MLGLSIGIGIAIGACSPAPAPWDIDTCETCAQIGQPNRICELNIQYQAQDQNVVVCVPPSSSVNAECNTACLEWSAEDNGEVCLGYVARGTFQCEGTPAGTYGGLGSSWSPSDYVDYDAANDVYIVDQELVDALNEDASILANDSTYLEELSSGGFKFNDVTAGSLADELGFQNGDIPQTINSYSVTSWGAVFYALDNVRTATDITVVVTRGSSTITLDYEVQ